MCVCVCVAMNKNQRRQQMNGEVWKSQSGKGFCGQPSAIPPGRRGLEQLTPPSAGGEQE